jgi:hypothetical protein
MMCHITEILILVCVASSGKRAVSMSVDVLSSIEFDKAQALVVNY